MKRTRNSLAMACGRHAHGNAGAPVLLVFTDRFDADWAAQLEQPLRHLHARSAINFSAYCAADVQAAGSKGWKPWLWELRPHTVLLAHCDGPDAAEILDYSHLRGRPVVCHVGHAPADAAAKAQAAWSALLDSCDLIHPASSALAQQLRMRFPRRQVFPLTEAAAGAGDELLEQRAAHLLQATTRLARRSPWQKLQGLAQRAAGWVARHCWGPVQRAGDPQAAPLRVLFVANSFLPTLQLCFTRPLQPLADADRLAWEVLADIQLHWPGRLLSGGRSRWARRRIAAFRPDLIVFCRYSGAHAGLVTRWARAHDVPAIYHLDDDLLSVPPELGPEKYAFHNQPARLATVRHLLRTVDLVYCSTQPLLERMQRHGIGGDSLAARIHCPGEILRSAPAGGEFKIGYMGIDHAHDFQVALPALVRVLVRNPHVRFELFGPIAKPAALDQFGDRITQVEFVRSYDAFMGKFASLGWSVGICPLADTPFNRTKANNKWVEYTAVGAAVVATAGMLYDECCADGCGLLAGDDAQWEAALQALIDEPARRLGTVAAAQARLEREYSAAALREQVLALFTEVRARRAGGARTCSVAVQA